MYTVFFLKYSSILVVCSFPQAQQSYLSMGESLAAGKENGQQTVLCMPWLSTFNQNFSLIKANEIGHCYSDIFGLKLKDLKIFILTD